MQITKHHPIVLTLCTVVLCSWLLVSCTKTTPADAKPEGSTSSISGYNYTNEGIQGFSVNGASGSGVSIGGGYGTVCCIEIPSKWTPGLKAHVKWVRSDCGGNGPGNERCPFGGGTWQYKTFEADIAVEPYDRPNTVQVMFLPKDEVKIFVSPYDPDHRDHPGKLGRPHPIDHPEWKAPA